MIPNAITPDNISLFTSLFPQERDNIRIGKVMWVGHYHCRFSDVGKKLAKLNQNINR